MHSEISGLGREVFFSQNRLSVIYFIFSQSLKKLNMAYENVSVVEWKRKV